MIGILRPLNFGCIAVAAILTLSGACRAQIIPLHGTLEYSASVDKSPMLMVKAANGSPAYVLTLEPVRDVYNKLFGIDLVLHRPRAKHDAPNLLEPPGRWHGAQDYDFFASDYAPGQKNPIFPPARSIRIKNRKLNVSFSVANAKVRPADEPTQPDGYVFEALVIDVDVTNPK